MKLNSAAIHLPKEVLQTAYPLMEHFYTLQGEGVHTGTAAYFLRLGGCDVGCHWCDVKDSWNAAAHPQVNLAQMLEWIADTLAPIVVVTGGEPLMHNLHVLTRGIRALGRRTHIETSGAHPLTGQWDWVTYSPKKFKAPLPEVAAAAHELKVIVYNSHDLQWAETHAAEVGPDCALFLQPEWDRLHVVLPLMLDYVKANPRWRISLQTHKWLEIP
jgi:organic radical activating enzyme